MKPITLLLTLSLAALAASSPVPEAAVAKGLDGGSMLENIRAATPEEIHSVFGYHKFSEFLARQTSKRSNSPPSIFKRATVSQCRKYGAYYDYAKTAIYILASVPLNQRCGNNNTPPECGVMRSYGNASLLFCGSTNTSILCSRISIYLLGIANTCKYTSAKGYKGTGGYQDLNENPLNYVAVAYVDPRGG